MPSREGALTWLGEEVNTKGKTQACPVSLDFVFLYNNDHGFVLFCFAFCRKTNGNTKLGVESWRFDRRGSCRSDCVTRDLSFETRRRSRSNTGGGTRGISSQAAGVHTSLSDNTISYDYQP